MRPGPRRARGEGGETLVELVVSMSILGLTVVALVGGIGNSVLMSDIHRKQSTAGVVLHTYAESIEATVAASPTKYTDCAAVAVYASPAGFSSPAGYSSTVTSVTYWNGTTFASTCTSDQGVQKLTLRVTSSDARAVESLDLVVREPCRTTDAAC